MANVISWIRGSLIGAGAFGKVNLALNRESGELFAVKSIECNERTRSEMQAMENEIRILQGLNSPFVVKCLGSSYTVENGKSTRNVFMEYMPGGSMADVMKKFGGHLDEALIRIYTRNILQGIQYLHSQEIVHGDIKGKNVLVGSSGVKLADFGGARRMEEGAAVVVDSSLLDVKGTPLWMAPEVVTQVEQGPASDIWSLGCTVVEMATGKAPWSDIAGAANPFVVLYHIGCTEEVPDLPSCLSEQGHDFLRKCFQRDPRMRWTADQLLKHPFITDYFPALQTPEPSSLLRTTSPTSAFDFPSPFDVTSCYNSSIANSVPILSSPLFTKREPQQAAKSLQIEDPQKDSTTSSSATDFWDNSALNPSPVQWIVVRSPKSTSVPSTPSSSAFTSSSVAASCELTPCCSEEDSKLIVPVSQDFKEEVIVPEWASAASFTLEEEEGDDDVFMADDDTELIAEGASCSRNNDNDDDYFRGTTAFATYNHCRRAATSWSSSATSATTSSKNLELSYSASADEDAGCMASADGDARCMDSRERPKPKYASLKATLRRLESAHRNMAFRGRPKVQLKFSHRKMAWIGRPKPELRFIHRNMALRRRPKPQLRFNSEEELHELYRKLVILGTSSYSFRETRPFRRHRALSCIILERPVGITKSQLLLRNGLFLNKTATSPWRLELLGISLVNQYSTETLNTFDVRMLLLMWSMLVDFCFTALSKHSRVYAGTCKLHTSSPWQFPLFII